MGEQRKYRWVPAAAAAVLAVWLMARGGHPGGRPSPDSSSPQPTAAPASSPASTASPAPAASPSAPAQAAAYDPARFAGPVRTYAGRARVDPQLLMAILYNESYKPHDPALERAWQRLKPDSAFGIANMHRAAFEETRQGRDFAGRAWEELPDDPGLAIEAAAWYLHDLAAQLPAHPSAPFTENELLALGYNTGAGNMLLFARGTSPGPAARSYLDRLHDNLPKARAALGQPD
ncbi:transglycosylase SLT domain-containing protein [Kitasatospora sp. GP82]|uniref:transglycosylase SLT domain-containing protein n=1 Tax=Kitasatospora sp. GP82 TaxID=3035089 RepID=UPI002476EEF9|nr:transglycosylase SLT domain-containing protein [Kitasatospora sp. GP82]MDH6125469.1 hypothetical protein [Kitasatospora sp. GP82]